MISEHLHDIYIQLQDPGCSNSGQTEVQKFEIMSA
jgi:hypothetical protein